MNESCGCCEASVAPTPKTIENRPGLSAIAYRVGDYASFRRAMVEAISQTEIAVNGQTLRPLADWTTRADDDYGIALLDMWATVGDILTFYQERIANEAYLRTALFRESVLRLAALLGYEPPRGVAATAYLAFTLEEEKKLQIPIGLLVQSVPGQDEKPQKFETVEAIAARASLNKVRILPTPQPRNPLAAGSREGFLASDPTDLTSGAKLVVFNASRAEEKEATGVVQRHGRVLLSWKPAIQHHDFSLGTSKMFRQTRQLRLFGYNAPTSFMQAKTKKTGTSTEIEWREVKEGDDDYAFDLPSRRVFDLDARYDDLKPGTRLLVTFRGFSKFARLVTVIDVVQRTATLGPLEDTVTRVTFSERLPPIANLRWVTIHELVGPEIRLWNQRYPGAISGNTVSVPLSELESLESKRTVVLDDKEAKPATVTVTEAIPTDGDGDGKLDHLCITFTPALTRNLDSETAVLYGNVAKATHGETIADEVLGDGDAASAFQAFSLKKSPTTFVPRAGAKNGAANTLQVRVSGVLWHEAENLYGKDGEQRVYTIHVDDDGVMTVHFGDGQTGARLPSGRSNVVATYRQGIGSDGNVAAGSLTTLLDKPVGLKKVINPREAEGGSDPETLDAARENAPNTVRTFDRIVSLRDFEDAARAYNGVTKARAAWQWDGVERTVLLTVAGDHGAEIQAGSQTHRNLVADLDSRRDPNRKMTVQSFNRVPIQVKVAIEVDSDYEDETIQRNALVALRRYLAFDNLNLGQAIHLSDLYRILHGVEGVVAADVNRLQFRCSADRASHGASADPVQAHLTIFVTELATIEDEATDLIIEVGLG
jgi:uncharacterized phage protein gp47/JayE